MLKLATILLTAMVIAVASPALAEDCPVPEIKPAHPDREKFRSLLDTLIRNEEIKRLRLERNIRKKTVDSLRGRQIDLPEFIKLNRDFIKILKKPLITQYQLFWRNSRGELRGEPHYPWQMPEANLDLRILDWIEKWIPEYEKNNEWRRKQSGKYEFYYSPYEVWQWAIPREEDILKKLEDELEKLPERIERAEQALTKSNENLENELIIAKRNLDEPQSDRPLSFRPNDIWIGKWNYRLNYLFDHGVPNKTVDLIFQIRRIEEKYVVTIDSLAKITLLRINETKLEFDFDDDLETNVKLELTGPNSFKGKLDIPKNNRPFLFRYGNIVGERTNCSTAG